MKTSVDGLAVVAICNFSLLLYYGSLTTIYTICIYILYAAERSYSTLDATDQLYANNNNYNNNYQTNSRYMCIRSIRYIKIIITTTARARLYLVLHENSMRLLPSTNLYSIHFYSMLSCCDCRNERRRKNKRELIQTKVAMYYS